MEDIRPNSVACFDAQYTTRHISMFKVLLHFLAPSMQRKLAVYIKFMELQYTLQASNTTSTSLSDYGQCISTAFSSDPKHEQGFDFEQICDELLPYCEPHEKQQFLQIKNMFQTMRNLQNMMEMMETMKELFPEGMGTGDGQNGFNPEILSAMSTMFGGGDMDFSTMAEMFSGT